MFLLYFFIHCIRQCNFFSPHSSYIGVNHLIRLIVSWTSSFFVSTFHFQNMFLRHPRLRRSCVFMSLVSLHSSGFFTRMTCNIRHRLALKKERKDWVSNLRPLTPRDDELDRSTTTPQGEWKYFSFGWGYKFTPSPCTTHFCWGKKIILSRSFCPVSHFIKHLYYKG